MTLHYNSDNNVVKHSYQHISGTKLRSKLTIIKNELELGNVLSCLSQIRHLISAISNATNTIEDKEELTQVRIITLGHFSIELNGEPFKFKRKSQKRPLDLLKTMISLGNRPISKSHLSELLWPDSSGSASVSVINTNVSRLRNIIGKKAIITENGTISLNTNYCWVDCWELERLIAATKQKNEFNSNIFQLYRGDFLVGDELGWIIFRRKNIRDRILNNLNRYVLQLIQNKQFKEAISFLYQCISLNNDYEYFYINLMRCQALQSEFLDAESNLSALS